MITNLPDREADPEVEASPLALLDELATALRWARFGGAEVLDRDAVAAWASELSAARPAPQPALASVLSQASAPPIAPRPSASGGVSARTESGPSPLRLRERQPWPGAVSDAPPTTAATTPIAASAPAVQVPPGGQGSATARPQAPSDLPSLRRATERCARCRLHVDRAGVVHGEGAAGARVLIVVDPPRGAELSDGRPLTGGDRELLGRMMASIGLEPADVYLAPTARCGPRALGADVRVDAGAAELYACRPILAQELALVRPRVVLVMTEGAGALLAAAGCRDVNAGDTVAALRERIHDLRSLPAIVTWPPASLYDDRDRRRQAQADLRELQRRLAPSGG